MSPSHPKEQATSPDLTETVVPGDKGASELQRTEVMSNDTSAGQQPSQPAPKKEGAKPSKSSSKKTYQLGDFELRKQLGEGGMGKVYLAHQISLDRDCALKVMASELAKKPGFVERFVREARSMAKIDHPHVVKCFAVGEDRGKHYVAMELIDGKSMQDWIDEVGTLSIADALHVTLLCADALEHAHSLKMIHRDIKPDNILVTKDGLVKVADLGLAKATDDDMSMTQSGTGLGTPHYMPPEQARNAKHVDSRCDIYALGCTLYHFVTGNLPFAGDSVVELITNKEKGQFTPARRANSKIPERLDLIIDKMMAKDPKHRYPTCAAVIKDLEALNLAGESLSFINSDNKAVLHRGGGMPTQKIGGTQVEGAAARPKQRPSGERRRQTTAGSQGRKAASTSGDAWYVRYEDANGRIKVSKMSRAQILQGLKSDKLNLKTRISRSSKGEFLPVGQIPVFEAEANKLVTRIQASRRETNTANAYAKIERQYNRQKWWRLLARFRDGTTGLVGLLIWLVVAFAILIGGGWGILQGYKYLAQQYGL